MNIETYDKHTSKLTTKDILLGTTPATSYEWVTLSGDPIARFHTFDWWDGRYIEDLFIYPPYRGHGLSYDLLDYAVRELGVTNLSVEKNNIIAKHIYDKYGFKVIDEDDAGIYYYMSISEPNSIN